MLRFLFLHERWSRFLFLYSGTFWKSGCTNKEMKFWCPSPPTHTTNWNTQNPDGSISLIHRFIFCLVSRFCCLLQVSLSEKFTVHIQAWIKHLCWRLWSWGSGAAGPEPVGRSENSCWSGSWAVMCSGALGKRVCFAKLKNKNIQKSGNLFSLVY